MKRKRTSGHDNGHHRLAQLGELFHQRFLCAGQIEKRAGVGFAGKNLLLAQEEQDHVGGLGLLDGVRETVAAQIAAVFQGRRVENASFAQLAAKNFERSLHIFGAAVHDPGAHLIDGAIGERPDHRDLSGRRFGERQEIAIILQQDDAFCGQLSGCLEGAAVT